MADDKLRQEHKSSNEYSGSQAPEVRKEAEERTNNFQDARLIPGGGRRGPADPGMSGLDRDTVPSRAVEDELADYGSSPDAPNPAPKVPH